MDKQQTNRITDKDPKVTDYITIYPNFKLLYAAAMANTTFLLGRGFDNLNKSGVSRAKIGECFDMTASNVTRAIELYKKLLPKLIPGSASPSQAQAVRRATACVPAEPGVSEGEEDREEIL